MKVPMMKKVGVSEAVLKNMVVCCKYTKPFKLQDRPTSAEYFYEREVFPAALISRWAPAHVALFHTGSLLCTGIKDWRHFHKIICDLHSYLSTTTGA